MAPDGRMFQTGGRKGELFDLKQALNATTMKERKKALKRTVAAMTLGRDVSSLFTDVVKNTAGDLSMKKLVYLYIINYAQANPDLSILIVNTFIKDANDQNPLIRALAIRTMALIPLEKITEYLCDPLHAALKDPDPYVRKTAAVCVAKLYDINPTAAVEEGFIKELQELLTDGNPMTVANAVAALSDIAESSQTSGLLRLTSDTVPKFLSALSECTEWGQIFILDAVSAYVPSDPGEAHLMVERIVPRLQHANPAVVLSAVKIIVNLMPVLDLDEKRTFLIKKMSAPLVTLLTAQPELQFVALRNISVLIREYPALLSGDVKVFFASYADPLYVKREKLDVLVRLTDEENATSVLSELVEYTSEVDVVFAQKAVDSIARIALRLPAVSGRCVDILSEILKRKVAYLTEQVAIGLKDIFREYPRQFKDIVNQLCGASDDIEDPSAKAALVWIIGEHADQLPSVVSMLKVISETIHEETSTVQLQTLTAVVKTYIMCGPEAQGIVDTVLKYATEESESVDIRDRGLIYKRLVSQGSDPMQKIVLHNRNGLHDCRSQLPPELQKELIKFLSSVASVYHKPARLFKGEKKRTPIGNTSGDMMPEEDLLGLDHSLEEASTADNPPLALPDTSASTSQSVGDSLLDDILGDPVPALPAPPISKGAQPGDDILSALGMSDLSVSSNTIDTVSSNAKRPLLSAEQGNGLSVAGILARDDNEAPVLKLELFNESQTPMTGFEIQFNKNLFGFTSASKMSLIEPLAPNSRASCGVSLRLGGPVDASKGLALQTAVRFAPGGVVYFALDAKDDIKAILNKKSGPMSKPAYLTTWKSIPDQTEVKSPIQISADVPNTLDWVSKKLEVAGIFTVSKRSNAKPPVIYLSASLLGSPKSVILADLTTPSGSDSAIVPTLSSRSTLPTGSRHVALQTFNQLCAQLLGR